jgi:uncharacterized membrane protein YphA (DoxX/SURF4 family)
MDSLNLAGWLAVRCTVAYVYLYALYLNTHDATARSWLIEHTAYLFPNTPEPQRTRLAKIGAFAGMAMMLLGGISILLGLEGRIGGLLLLLFTGVGIYQHHREREVAMAAAAKVEPLVPASGKADFATLQWSAYSGHISSGLKNWALCGISLGFFAWGTGPWSIIDSWAHKI